MQAVPLVWQVDIVPREERGEEAVTTPRAPSAGPLPAAPPGDCSTRLALGPTYKLRVSDACMLSAWHLPLAFVEVCVT